MVITFDGPAGSGKSTVARKLASRLGFIHLNSGALFRAVAVLAAENHVRLDDEPGVAAVASSLRFSFDLDDESNTLLLVNGGEFGERIRSEEVGEMASRVALLPSVRQVLLEVQRSLAGSGPGDKSEEKSLVVEGRDSGTVVFPNADHKFYLDASLDVRAERRLRELRDEDGDLQLVASVREGIARRDHADSTRAIAPQKIPDGAEVIDTSASTPDEVVERIVVRIQEGRR